MQDPSELKSKISTALRWAALGRIASQFITWGMTLVVIRLLTPADYGLMAISMMFISFGALLNEIGLSEVIVQKKELSERLVREIMFLLLAINLTLFVGFCFSAGLVANYFGEPRLAEIMWVSALQFPLGVIGAVPNALLVRKLDYKWKSIVESIAAGTGGLVALGMAYSGYGVWALVFGALTTTGGKSIGYWVCSPYLHWPIASIREARKSMVYGGYIFIERIIWHFYQQFDI